MSKVGILNKIKEKSTLKLELKADKCGVCLVSSTEAVKVIVDDGIFIAIGGGVVYSTDIVFDAIKYLNKMMAED